MMYVVEDGIGRSPDLHPETITIKYKLTTTDRAQTHDHPDMQMFALTVMIFEKATDNSLVHHRTYMQCLWQLLPGWPCQNCIRKRIRKEALKTPK